MAQPAGATAVPHRTTIADSKAMQALICLDNPGHQESCQQAIHSLGYMSDVMPNQFKALESLRETAYRLFILDAAFDGTSLDTNLVLTFLRERPLDQRRYQFVVLCAPDLTTADTIMAYSQSINLTINHVDMANCGAVLAQHLAEHEFLYRTFREMRQQLGKDI
jgi:CheY-like chemotaxis protein